MARHAIRNPLLLPELFHYILDYIDLPNAVEIGINSDSYIRVFEPSRAARRALFALAQTCRAISEPSLDRLWRVLGSLVPLIRCFAQVADVDSAMTPPSPAEWAIISRYAARVRELCIAAAPHSMDSLCFLQCTSSQPLWLLPNLRVLIWEPNPPSFTPLIERFLVPGLVSLDITLLGREDSPRRLFERHAALCPNLKALRWNFDPGVYHLDVIFPVTHVLSDSVLRLRKIGSLDLFAPLDPIPLKHVILSPDYKVLGVMLDRLGMQQVDITSADTPFPNVKTIKLEICNLDSLTSLLRPHQQIFRTLVFRLHSEEAPPVHQSMLSCFTALATPQRINSVQSIKIYFDYRLPDVEVQVLEDAPTSYCITYETLSPLASFCCLRKLMIMMRNQISIDDDELATLARSWPSLEVLHLHYRLMRPWVSAKYVTLRGLLALIAACPELYELCLVIDARIVPMDASLDICNTAIKRIQLSDSPISKPRLVADFFRKHLPCVKDVDVMWSKLRGGDVVEMFECARMWREVQVLL